MMIDKFAGIVMLVRDVHCEKVDTPVLVKPDGSVIDDKLEQ